MEYVVRTEFGQVVGERAVGQVCVFRGIPYAQPPVGALRFRAPQPPRGWQGVRDARSFAPAAPQLDTLSPDMRQRSEDCLYLNVWTPGLAGARKPVMVWIHGGGFTSGSSSQQLYDAGALAADGDVVVVTLNYRLGMLGFGYLRELLGPRGAELPANVGLLDQIAALEWVRANIEAFGGDPENVTVFGESAGAMSAAVLLGVPRARRLFQRVIAQSGAAHHALAPDQASRIAEVFLRALGGAPERIWTASEDELVAAQRDCYAPDVLRGRPGRELPQQGFPLMPVIDRVLLPEHPFEAIARGAAREHPLLIGLNWDEWNYFLFLNEPNKRDVAAGALPAIFDKRLPGHGEQALALYRRELGEAAPAWQLYSAFESDRVFRAPALLLADAQVAAGGSTFGYVFDQRSELFGGALGACHALEIPFVFGTLTGPFGRTFTGASLEAQALSREMLAAWSAFARCGDPSQPGLGPWEPYSERRSCMRLGPSTGMVNAPLEPFHQFWSAHL